MILASTRAQARFLRRHMTDAEKKLWAALRGKQLAGAKFRRQHPIGPYIADFACPAFCLIVEADGGQHNGSAHDKIRDAYLRQQGWTVLRFWNNDIHDNIDGVLLKILDHLSVPLPTISTGAMVCTALSVGD